ncbi:MAG: P-type conjugative transfer protein VirB9 [Rickettsiales bacterium]
MKLKNNIFRILIIFFIAFSAHAAREPRAISLDSRLRVWSYDPNVVYKYIGYLGYQGSIVFGDGEAIETISMGDPTGWQIINSGNRLFLKPTSKDATTNMTLITNMRLYFFEMHAEETDSIDDPGLAFQVKFLYPTGNNIMDYSGQAEEPDLSDKKNLNFNYTISGSDLIAPIKIFDNGVFTYFQFRDKNQPIPAFFRVTKEGEESMVNYQVMGDYIVLTEVSSQYTLRYGKEITCVFNENFPLGATWPQKKVNN